MNEGRTQNLSNLRTEKKGLDVLLESNSGFYIPDKEEKMKLYDLCEIDYKKYSRSVDCIQLMVESFGSIKDCNDFNFIEVKTTKDKKVTELPFGVFFGFTMNEETLFQRLSNYRLCIVHTGLKDYYTMDYDEYESLIKHKRVQYQINFRTK